MTRTLPSLTAALALVGGVTVLAGCAGFDRSADAEDLRARLADLPGVEEVTLDYSKPVTLDSGKVQLVARMADGAEDEQVADVLATTYRAFADTHKAEEGDLDVRVDDDVLHLRSFEPDAEPEAVQEAASAAASVRSAGAIRADLDTDDVAAEPHVRSSFDIDVGPGGPEAVLRVLDGLEERYSGIPDASWTVRSGETWGWMLSDNDGFPDERQVGLWADLREGLPAGATVSLWNDGMTVLDVPRGTTPDALVRIAERHLALLEGTDGGYEVMVDGSSQFNLIDGDCIIGSGAVAERLRSELADVCDSVSDQPS